MAPSRSAATYRALPTQRDVAVAAGVSVRSVSNVVNGATYVSDSMRLRVERAIAELGYRPNGTAQNLRRGYSGLIALAVPSLRNAYFTELADEIVGAADKYGRTVLVDCTYGKRSREEDVLEGFSGRIVDGIILCPHALSAADLRKRKDRTPLVMLGERVGRGADCIAIDSRAAAFVATSHLLDIGRRRIGVIGFESGSSVGTLRLAGYRDALAQAGLPDDPERVEIVSPERYDDFGLEAIGATATLLERNPDLDALFCFNDVIAIAAMHYLLSEGKRVPEDIAVIGVDDIEAAKLSWPSLSTISPNAPKIADTAVQRLIRRIEGRRAPATRGTMEIQLIVRGSTL